MDVLYEGQRFAASGGATVWIVDDLGEKQLLPHAIVKHSPDGFEWGYGGSGPSELALNLLARALGPAGECARCGTWGERTCVACHGTGLAPVVLEGYQAFKRAFIEPLPGDVWTYTRTQIIEWAASFESQRAASLLLHLAGDDAGAGAVPPVSGAAVDPAQAGAPLRGVPS